MAGIADFHRGGCYRLDGERKWKLIVAGCRWAHPAELPREGALPVRRVLLPRTKWRGPGPKSARKRR